MKTHGAIAVLGTFDSKGEEHLFLKSRIEERGLKSISINVGTLKRASVPADMDLFDKLEPAPGSESIGRDRMLEAMILLGQKTLQSLYSQGMISGVISAGGGTGTHLCSEIMHVLPMGIPKVMVSTVASRNMSTVVGTSDIIMFHSVTDILGVNSITGQVLDKAAAAVCAMAESRWSVNHEKKRIALSFFGFITRAAENVRHALEQRGYEVVPFHANGTGGMAMVKLAGEGYFHGILDLATHELVDAMFDGYCGGIGPSRYEPIPGKQIPRLLVPGGMDCAVLEFTRDTIPEAYQDRKIFFYDFRSAIALTQEESVVLAGQLSEKLNMDPNQVHLLLPAKGFSEADQEGAPLHDPQIKRVLIEKLKETIDPKISVKQVNFHINDPEFGIEAASLMDRLVQESAGS